jgi:hypothetical protein
VSIDSTWASNGLEISPTALEKKAHKPSRYRKKKRQRTGLIAAGPFAHSLSGVWPVISESPIFLPKNHHFSAVFSLFIPTMAEHCVRSIASDTPWVSPPVLGLPLALLILTLTLKRILLPIHIGL